MKAAHTVSLVCYVLLALLGLDMLHRIGVIRLVLLVVLAAVGFVAGTIAKRERKGAAP